ncbi:MAG: sensor histidine kinase [Roseateles sp.]|uniref:histidine kinase n=1 Tax=Roseateles asaccharophilus TaxID=582607 RepID=A0ABU2AHR0_9BURK|nr:HAMP domain-containing sensor histidine kinase [Roseateles asaccharophilus]MDR7336178.1 signal transduction histidine kinase [Roseateles asaccharophilus]
MRSLERDLLKWIVGTLALGTVLLTVVAYLVTLTEMHEVFDDELKTIAEGVARMHQANQSWQSSADLPVRTDIPDDSEIVTQSWTIGGRRLFISDPRVALPFSPIEGHSEPMVRGERWIVHTVTRGGYVAQAAQRQSQRQQMAGESAVQISTLMVALVAGVGALLIFSLRRGLAPLDVAALDIATRSAGALSPIRVGNTPKELMPVIESTNELLRRLGEAFSAQRRFLADAAHELRTPITALRLQLQILQRSPDETSRQAALEDLEAGIDRSQHLVEQLLQVARSEPDVEMLHSEPVDLAALARNVASAFTTQADSRDVDLGVRVLEPAVVEGDLPQLTVLLNNLVDNALRYAPGAAVDIEVALEAEQPVLRVVDHGPGIPEAERGRVFDRFFRGVAGGAYPGGSGLGLAIVRAIADRHGAMVEIDAGDAGRGLSVRVVFPATTSAASA